MNRKERRAAQARGHGNARASHPGKGFSEADIEMLAAGRSFLDLAQDPAESTARHVLTVVDLNDRIGFEAAAVCLQAAYDVSQETAEMELRMLCEPDPSNPTHRPLVAFWITRPALVPLLTALGFGVPNDWEPALAHPPAPGKVWTLLKRDGRGLLAAFDFSAMPGHWAPQVVLR